MSPAILRLNAQRQTILTRSVSAYMKLSNISRRRKVMKTNSAFILAFALAAGIAITTPRPAAPQEGVTRTVLLKKPLEADPKKEVTMFVAEYKPGAKSGKHYHPGQEFVYVIEGEGKLEEVGKPAVDLKPGVAVYFQSDPAKPTYV